MKLLFDENLSHKLPALFVSSFPDSQHVRTLGLKGGTDEQIWEHAQTNGFAILLTRHMKDIAVFETSQESILILS